MTNKMTCRYYDCGWCYAPEDVKNNSIQGGCFEPEYCATYLMQNKPKMTEKPFYRFFVIDYYGTGNGRSIYLQISLSNHNDEYYEKEWKHFVNYDFYLQGAEQLEEREFLDRYTRLIPDMTVHMLREKSLTIWQSHLNFNRS